MLRYIHKQFNHTRLWECIINQLIDFIKHFLCNVTKLFHKSTDLSKLLAVNQLIQITQLVSYYIIT